MRGDKMTENSFECCRKSQTGKTLRNPVGLNFIHKLDQEKRVMADHQTDE